MPDHAVDELVGPVRCGPTRNCVSSGDRSSPSIAFLAEFRAANPTGAATAVERIPASRAVPAGEFVALDPLLVTSMNSPRVALRYKIGNVFLAGAGCMMYVDSALLDFTERLCRHFQSWSGRTNVWLAFQLTNLSIIVYFAWVAVLYWLTGMLALRVFVALFCGGVFLVLTRTLFKVSIETSETQAYGV
jgi:hypothetical protein